MELNADKQLVRKVLSNKNRYNIPRYQREYSWEKNEISEYFCDILKQLKFEDNMVKSDDYFIGSILLTGDYNSSGKIIDVVDGQQRLTTITIFLSALTDAFAKIQKVNLYNIVWEYIIGKDDDGKEYPILFNEIQYLYFQYYIQRKEREDIEPSCEEEDRIKDAFTFFQSNLSEVNLRKAIITNNAEKNIDKYSYEDLLKGIRDQVLNSYVICIWTTETKYANEIFEILNAKGKQLTSVDLIKNNIFKILDEEIPDDPKLKWKDIKKNLNHEKGRIDFTTYFRHYWISKYKKVTQEKLYDDFIKTIDEDKEHYREFLNDLLAVSKTYMKIVNPRREDYDNRKEYFYLVESLKSINNIFNITQARIAFLALYIAKDKQIITFKQFKTVVKYIEDFHFIYNAVCTLRANAFEGIYSQFAIALNKSKDGNEAQKAIELLHNRLLSLYPEYETFEAKFTKINYSKSYSNNNVFAKYIVNRIDKYYGNREISRDDGSVEHILSESKYEDYSLNIGNLILLEISINGSCENMSYEQKMLEYAKSNYEGVKEYLNQYAEYKNWGEEEIQNRAKKLASIVYHNIINYRSN